MLWLDKKYLNLISSQLERFSVKSENPYTAAFRCPICGDSSKNASKKRGNIYQKSDGLMFKCFNCGASHRFPTFLKTINPQYYKEYVMEKFKDLNEPNVFEQQKKDVLDFIEEPIAEDSNPFSSLKSISELPDRHPAKRYVMKRKIPTMYWDHLYFAPKFIKWTLTHTDKYKKMLDKDHPRLVIPFYDENNKLFAWQGRSFGDENPKYLTWKNIDEHKPFGLNYLDLAKTVYVLEGPIDSMFINNALAVYCSDLLMCKIGSDRVYVSDNEPRNKEIVKQYQKIIDAGEKIVIWPEYITEKDINEMVQAGRSPAIVQDIINKNTFSGPIAQMKLNVWKKC